MSTVYTDPPRTAPDIVVAAPTSFSDAGSFGELLATSLKARGVSGRC